MKVREGGTEEVTAEAREKDTVETWVEDTVDSREEGESF